jgi:hypothetical protein
VDRLVAAFGEACGLLYEQPAEPDGLQAALTTTAILTATDALTARVADPDAAGIADIVYVWEVVGAVYEVAASRRQGRDRADIERSATRAKRRAARIERWAARRSRS